MKRSINVYLKEYCKRLSDENIDFLSQRLSQRLSGDIAETLNFIGETREIDKWLGSAVSCDDLFSMLDKFQEILDSEASSRKAVSESPQKSAV